MRISDWSSDVCSSDLGSLCRSMPDQHAQIMHRVILPGVAIGRIAARLAQFQFVAIDAANARYRGNCPRKVVFPNLDEHRLGYAVVKRKEDKELGAFPGGQPDPKGAADPTDSAFHHVHA